MPVLCHYCPRPATLLCDGQIAGLSYDGKTFASIFAEHPTRSGGVILTCDRAICDRCATRAGHVFYDGERGGKRWGEVDTEDYCPGCVRELRHTEHGPPLLFVDLAGWERLRIERLRRERIRVSIAAALVPDLL